MLLECFVVTRLVSFVTTAGLIPSLQSAYRVNHSTETAVLRVLSDILLALDQGDFTALALPDWSVAFNTVDHSSLLRRLRISYGICGSALSWMRSYLCDRSQFVHSLTTSCRSTTLRRGVPRGSVLKPILFLTYTADLLCVITKHGLRPRLFADDTQVYASSALTGVDALQSKLSTCLSDIGEWVSANRLQLNAVKTGAVHSGRSISYRLNLSMSAAAPSLSPSSVMRDLGV